VASARCEKSVTGSETDVLYRLTTLTFFACCAGPPALAFFCCCCFGFFLNSGGV